MRAFVAVKIPDEISRRVLMAAPISAVDRCAEVRWVDPSNIHLTFLFLGEISDATAKAFADGCRDVLKTIPGLVVQVGGLGVFGANRSPRVLWAGVHAEGESLSAIHSALRDSASRYGIPTDSNPFSPHVTLGRIKRIRPEHELTIQKCWAKKDAFGEFSVYSLHMYESTLTPQGAQYDIRYDLPLKGV